MNNSYAYSKIALLQRMKQRIDSRTVLEYRTKGRQLFMNSIEVWNGILYSSIESYNQLVMFWGFQVNEFTYKMEVSLKLKRSQPYKHVMEIQYILLEALKFTANSNNFYPKAQQLFLKLVVLQLSQPTIVIE